MNELQSRRSLPASELRRLVVIGRLAFSRRRRPRIRRHRHHDHRRRLVVE